MKSEECGGQLNIWAETCWDMLTLRPTTLREYKRRYAREIAPFFGERSMDTITRAEVQIWVLSLTVTKSRACLPVLKTLYREANRFDYCETNPTTKIRTKAHIPARREFRTWDEIDSIDFGRYNDLFRFLALHGLRWSEARALRQEDIHDGLVWITKSAEGLPTKSGRARTVPYLGHFSESWPRSYKWARVTLHEKAGVTIHSLRKTYAHRLKTIGVHPQVAQKLLGHASITLTMDLYTDVLPSEITDAGALLRESLSKSQPGSEGERRPSSPHH